LVCISDSILSSIVHPPVVDELPMAEALITQLAEKLSANTFNVLSS
jgi:hypothetical protein